MRDNWKRHPPLHWMVAAYLGYGERPAEPKPYMDADAFAAMMRVTGGKID